MTKKRKLFIDTDFLSCFLYTNKGSIIQRVFDNYDIFVPHAVDSEVERNRRYISSSDKKRKIIAGYDYAKANNYFQIMDDFLAGSDEFEMVMQLNGKGFEGGPSVGIGEAQVIAAAYYREGEVASNNLRDVEEYRKILKFKLWTASDILYKAYEKGIESETVVANKWQELIDNGYKLAANSFEEFKKRKGK